MSEQNPTTKRSKIPDPIQSLGKPYEAKISNEAAQQEENMAQLARVNNRSIATLRGRARELYEKDSENKSPEQNKIEVQLRPESSSGPAIIATVGVVRVSSLHQPSFVSVNLRARRENVDSPDFVAGFISNSYRGEAPVFGEQIGTGDEANFIQHSPINDGTENDPDMTYFVVTEALALAAHEAETQQLAT